MMTHDDRNLTGSHTYGYLNLHYYNFRTPQHTPRQRLEQHVFYAVYGRKGAVEQAETRPQRGPIYDQHGDLQPYGHYKAWALGTSRRKPYMYQLKLTPKHHILEDNDFVSLLREANREHDFSHQFRLVIHTNTDHKHAHVLFPADKTITKNQLLAWSQTVRENIITHEHLRCQQKQMPLPRVGEPLPLYQARTTAWRTAVNDGLLSPDEIDKDPPGWSAATGGFDPALLEEIHPPQPHISLHNPDQNNLLMYKYQTANQTREPDKQQHNEPDEPAHRRDNDLGL